MPAPAPAPGPAITLPELAVARASALPSFASPGASLLGLPRQGASTSVMAAAPGEPVRHETETGERSWLIRVMRLIRCTIDPRPAISRLDSPSATRPAGSSGSLDPGGSPGIGRPLQYVPEPRVRGECTVSQDNGPSPAVRVTSVLMPIRIPKTRAASRPAAAGPVPSVLRPSQGAERAWSPARPTARAPVVMEHRGTVRNLISI